MKFLNLSIFKYFILIYFVFFTHTVFAATLSATTVPDFQADLTNSMIPLRGVGVPTFTRATTAYVQDWEGLMRPVLSGEARFTGARRVRNLLPATEIFTTANNWYPDANTTVTSNSAVAPDGSMTAATVTNTSGGTRLYNNNLTETPAGNTTSFSVWLKSASGSYTLRLRIAKWTNVTISTADVTVTPTWQRFTYNSVTGTNGDIFVLGDGIYTMPVGTTYVWHPQLEDVTGQSNQNPSEYVSVGKLNAPYHGAGVDGVKYFNTTNGNSVSSNIVTELPGTLITSYTPGASSVTTDMLGPFGYLAEGARTNIALQSQTFQTTWTPTNTSIVADQYTAPDGTVTADKWLATAGSGQHVLVQGSISVTSGTIYTGSVYLKYVNTQWVLVQVSDGTTNYIQSVDLLNGVLGAASAGVTATIKNINGYYRVTVTATVGSTGSGNIALGMNSSDVASAQTWTAAGTEAIGLWGAQIEVGSFASSYIPTVAGALARNADLLYYSTAGNINAYNGTAYGEMIQKTDNTYLLGSDTRVTYGGVYGSNGGVLRVDDGAILRNLGISTPTNTLLKEAVAWSPSVLLGTVNGVAPANTAFSNSANFIGTKLVIGNDYNLGYEPYGTIRNLKIWKKALTSAQLKNITSTSNGTSRATVPVSTIKTANESGLVGYWPMEEGVGTKVGDTSGLGNAATFSGTPLWVKGKRGKALQFDGSTNYIRNDNFSIGTDPNFTISAWVKRTASVNSKGVWGLGAGGVAGQTISTWNNVGEKIGIDLWSTATFYVNTDYPLNDWVHVTWVKNGTSFSTNSIKIYVNGIEQPLLVSRGVAGTNYAETLTNGFTIGGMYPAGSVYDAPAVIDDVHVYNRVLSSTEIYNLYKLGGGAVANTTNNKSASFQNGLVGLWTFDGKDVNWGTNKALDRSGFGNDGLLGGMGTTTSPTFGKIGQALKFNGSSSYIRVTNASSLNTTSALTYSYWINGKSWSVASIPISNHIQSHGSPVSGVVLSVDTSGKPTFQLRVNNTCCQAVAATTNMTLGVWYLVTNVWDGANMYIYINGKLENSLGNSGTMQINRDTFIGTNSDDFPSFGGASSAWLNGSLDDVRIYNRALSATEVKQLYNAGR